MKLSLRGTHEQTRSIPIEETGEPMTTTLPGMHHIRTQGFPIPIGYQSGMLPEHHYSLQVREKDVTSQPIDVKHRTSNKSKLFYSNQNEWLKDRLTYLVPGTELQHMPITEN